MKIKLIYSCDYCVLDQFYLDMSLEDSVKYLNSKYVGEYMYKDGTLYFYVTYKKRG